MFIQNDVMDFTGPGGQSGCPWGVPIFHDRTSINNGHFGKFSSSKSLKMNYCYWQGVQKSVLCWEVMPLILKGSLSMEITEDVHAKRCVVLFVTEAGIG